MAHITLDQLKVRYLKHLEAAVKITKHQLIRILITKGASNAMALAVLEDYGKTNTVPNIRMTDVRWNRNQWAKQDDDNYIGHAEADAKEKRATGSMLDPSTETRKAQKVKASGTEMRKAQKVKASGTETRKAQKVKASGTKTGGAKSGGTKTGGTKTGGAKSGGTKASGTKTGGAKSRGKERDLNLIDIEF